MSYGNWYPALLEETDDQREAREYDEAHAAQEAEATERTRRAIGTTLEQLEQEIYGTALPRRS